MAPPTQYVAPMDRTTRPGAEHAIRSSVVSNVLCAIRPVVAEGSDTRAWVVVLPFGPVEK